MANLNKVLLMGNMTRNPQLSYLPSNTPVVEFGLAINRRYKKQDGTMADEPCYVDCRLFGKRAEVVNKYFKKGDPIFVEGRLQYDAWEKDGKKQSKLRVFVENFEFIGKGSQAAGSSPAESSDYEQAPETSYGPAEDDIPF
ncbi:MAG TPA: single-stranded DNA-binding protein [Anaerohalosphaeraceae bacterium]|nr:single-stranded DNA-binding protein [Phycisphaerae bacterium]HOK95371.1 single-stranded DNA-binding protein [Anaerohalosphaeraceae bacterium]HOL31003.1 single-stranded DNA-binding protein [Anaerohalosphaeraceae bacterium]HPO69089.1 single-stranded DNA-binding protein [Anaerohalosphaeraceae bacterium]HRV19490.1 single-stranded DNA-binding protein [Anaerohalosphaeraceae bacterium]